VVAVVESYTTVIMEEAVQVEVETALLQTVLLLTDQQIAAEAVEAEPLATLETLVLVAQELSLLDT
jgi:hypothetical protein